MKTTINENNKLFIEMLINKVKVLQQSHAFITYQLILMSITTKIQRQNPMKVWFSGIEYDMICKTVQTECDGINIRLSIFDHHLYDLSARLLVSLSTFSQILLKCIV